MRTSIRQRIRKFIIEYSKYNHWHKVAVCMAAIVAVLTVSALVLPAVTMGHSAYCGKEEHTHTNECYEEQLICGYEEGSGTAHVHDDSCYTEEKELICPLEETPGHTHTQDCISTERQLVCGNEEPEHEHTSECYEVTETYICGQEESAGHTHTDECYKVNKVLTCTADESEAAHQHTDACYEKVLVCTKEEHTHTLICYSDPTADVESRQTWEQTMAKVELSGDWSEDVIAIAQSQLGYHESKTNYIVNTVDGEEVMKGYSRYGEWYSSAYGEWYGDTYADWSGMFVSFCLYYAGIPDNQFIWDADCSRWMTSLSKANLYGSAGQYTPVQGDIVFLDYDKDGTVDHAGIVEKVNDKEIGTIEGDSEDSVSRRTYKLTDDKLMGYGILPEEPANAENLQASVQSLEAEEEQVETAQAVDEVEAAEATEPANMAQNNANWYMMDVPSVLSAEDAGEPAAQSEEGTVQASSTEKDFTNWITDATLQYAPANSESWQDLKDDSVLQENDRLKFSLSYSVPGGELSSECKTIVYQITDKINLVEATSGDVIDKSKKKVGEYTITEDGKISITFTDECVNDNQKGFPVNGTIAFRSSVDHISKDDTGKIDLPFGDNLHIEINVEEKAENPEDLKVSKTETIKEGTTDTVSYTITVNSQNGTSEPVILKDIMDQVLLDGGTFSVLDKNGKTVKDISVPTQGAGDFELKLPAMEAGDQYTITYTAKLKDGLNDGVFTGKNNVVVTSKDKKGKELEDETSVETRFEKELLEKKGEKLGDGRTKWTIVVNKGKQDIGGWTLSDKLNGQEFKEKVTIDPAIDGNNTVTLPIQFPFGTKETYTITYVTDMNYELGNTNFVNTAILTDTNQKEYKKDSYDGQGYYNPLTKKADSITSNGDTATIQWHVDINATMGDIKGETKDNVKQPWTYTDELQNGQWFDEEQIQEAETNIRNSLAGLESQIRLIEFVRIPVEGEDGKYKGFTAKLDGDLKKGCKIEFIYNSTAPLGDGTQTLNFKNHANINNKVSYDGSVDYNPPAPTVEKYDLYNQNGGEETNHDFQKDGILSWGIRINVDDCDEALVVTERLPADVTLQDPLKINAGQWREFKFNGENQASVNIDSDNNHWLVIAEKKEDGSVEIQIPQEVVAYVKNSQESSHNIILEISVKLNDDAIWTDKENGYECVRLKNRVTVTTKSGIGIGTGEQTQIVNKKKESNIIKKAMTGEKDNTGCVHNIIPYSITINPEAKDLLEGTDTLKLNDVINLYDRNNISLSLIQDSVKVYHVNSDGSKGELLMPMEYPYTYNVKRGPDFTNPSKIYSLSIQIPDSQALIVEYEYSVSGNNGTTVYGISNSATLEGVSESLNGDKIEANVKVVDSDAEANLDGVILRKVDADNNGIALPGAEFELYVWNSSEYVPILDANSGTTKKFITNSKGEFEMTKLAYNTAYKLVEVKAPDNYSQNKNPYYFLIKDSNVSDHPVCKPVEFEGEELDIGSYIIYPNTKSTTEILVKKIWRDSNGKDITSETGGSIEFELWKHAEVAKGTGVPLSCEILYGWCEGVWEEFKTSDYSAGTELEFSLTDSYNQYFGNNKPKIFFNNEEVAPIKEPVDANDKPYIYTYRIILKDGTNKLTGTVNRNNYNNDHWGFSGLTVVSTPQSGTVELPEDEKVLYTLTKEDGWQKMISGLPKTGVLEDADKTAVDYTYSVKEVPVQNCITEISKNDNNSYQIFTITNTKPDNPSYELPETGGLGKTPYTMAGIALIAMAALLYIYRTLKLKK